MHHGGPAAARHPPFGSKNLFVPRYINVYLVEHGSQKRELGRHAFEDRMPDRIASIITAEGTSNDLDGVITKLAQLLRNDRNLEVAYLCTDSAVQVNQLPSEGAHFCGYRNMQMMLLALRSTEDRLPYTRKLTIPQLQDLIEAAWTRGYNPHGRVQTGGIRGTRRHVGTSEVQQQHHLYLSVMLTSTGGSVVIEPRHCMHRHSLHW